MQTTQPTYSLPSRQGLIARTILFTFAALAVEYVVFSVFAGAVEIDTGLFGAVFVTIIVSNVAFYVLQRKLFRSHSYHWYKTTFPSHVRNDGRVVCRHCNGTHVHVRNLLQQTYHRAHVCNQCGATLYFSPE